MQYTVIKGYERKDLWDWEHNCSTIDPLPIGYVTKVDGQIPESFIKYVPNRIIDKTKYPELVKLFGKTRLPSEFELEIWCKKNNYWKKKESLVVKVLKWLRIL